MLKVESALTVAEGKLNLIPRHAVDHILKVIENFSPDLQALRNSTKADGVVVPGLVLQLKEAVGSPDNEYVHFGATSQDIVDTSLVIRSKEILSIFSSRLKRLVQEINSLIQDKAHQTLMGKTRMQSALPMTLWDRVRNWQEPVNLLLTELPRISDDVGKLQLAGAVGTLDKLGEKGAEIRKVMADILEIKDPLGPWHVQRLSLARLASYLSELTATLGKMGTDVVLMTQNETATALLKSGGKSSVMPHKKNPVDAEILVSFSRYNSSLLGGMHNALIHEQERSGTAWTLEWLVLPQMFLTTGAALNAAVRLARVVEFPSG
jgi:3-carboxy-cis,cis-muconate cycloisomerase